MIYVVGANWNRIDEKMLMSIYNAKLSLNCHKMPISSSELLANMGHIQMKRYYAYLMQIGKTRQFSFKPMLFMCSLELTR